MSQLVLIWKPVFHMVEIVGTVEHGWIKLGHPICLAIGDILLPQGFKPFVDHFAL